jgi:hypothetical protein
MSGHVAKPRRRWPWAILSFLFALAFAWSLAVMGERVGGFWSILRIGSAVGLGISLLLLVRAFISSATPRRARTTDGGRRATKGRGGWGRRAERAHLKRSSVSNSISTREVFPRAGDERPETMAGRRRRWRWGNLRKGCSGSHADLDEAVDQVEAAGADGESQENLRRIREEFKARAEEAALRVKLREAELHEAASSSDAER